MPFPGTWLSTRLRADYRADVELLQLRLNEHGYRVAVDGHYGPQTRDAVNDFKALRGLDPGTGAVGPGTWDAIVNHR